MYRLLAERTSPVSFTQQEMYQEILLNITQKSSIEYNQNDIV